jgi:hypothetical protein
VSYNRLDVEHGYCSACRAFTGNTSTPSRSKQLGGRGIQTVKVDKEVL